MKILYVIAWVVILAFLAWSANLLLEIQSIDAKRSELHQLSENLDSLAGSWRDLNRPGNDVLEEYAVESQRAALSVFKIQYQVDRDTVEEKVLRDEELATPLSALDAMRLRLVNFAEDILDLAQLRESLRAEQAEPELIREKETAAAKKMAKMDQVFQTGLDQVLVAKRIVSQRERAFEALQTRNYKRLYVMFLVALLASALSLELIRHTIQQREALRESSTRINTIVNNVVDGIVTTNLQGKIESINMPGERMFGYASSEATGQRFTELLDEHCQKEYLTQLERDKASARGSTISEDIEEFGKRRDGSRFPIELSISRVMVKGEPILVHIVRDITSRRQADQEQRLAKSVFENTSEGIVVTDINGTIQSVNPAYTEITQYSAAELLGQNPRMIKSKKQDAAFYQQMWSAIKDTGHWQSEIWNKRKSGELFPQWLTISAIRDYRGRTTNYIGVAWDISQLKEAERKKEEFIATISHELRTPLTSVLVALGMIIEETAGELPAQSRRLVGVAHSNSRRLVRLISDILDIQKIEAGRMNFEFYPLEINGLVSRVVEDSRALAEQTEISMDLVPFKQELWVSGDGDRLMQALTNLISNAVKFSPSGESVRVEVSVQNAMVRVSVTDNGPGIPEEHRSEIFKKFVQLDDVGGGRKDGSGLGLNITRLIVQQHNGLIDYKSKRNEGTTFFFDLPEIDSSQAGKHS